MYSTVLGTGIAGLLLLFLEMFLPGLIAGIVGAVLLIVSIAVAYTTIGPEAGNLTLVLATLGSGGLWWWWATRFQHTRFGRSMTLETTVGGTAGAPDLKTLPGQEGSAVTDLRPSGTVLIGGRRVDAVTEGEYVVAGTAVQVVRTHGLGVVVRKTA